MPKPALLLPVPASPPGRVQRVTKESTRDKVYSSLRNAILSGRLHCGERVKEIPLAEELGVSRAILREAMQQLVHEGLLESNSYRGARVIELRPEQIDEIVEARILLEGRAVRLAAERIHNAQREELNAFEKQLQREKDPLRVGQFDFRLHQRIWQISGHATIEKLLIQLTSPLFAMSLLMRSKENRDHHASSPLPRGTHKRLIEAICQGTPNDATRELEAHLTENWTAIRRRVAEFIAREEAEKL
ncbi:MAG: GntR family transcriptional regulator [Acidobacteriota bacterium]|jgi:DNA-binding GntR family transcriptional regulator|nr:GntR family transcriptional regulator [Bryobacteraceae bacterium CoA2 C42]